MPTHILEERKVKLINYSYSHIIQITYFEVVGKLLIISQ